MWNVVTPLEETVHELRTKKLLFNVNCVFVFRVTNIKNQEGDQRDVSVQVSESDLPVISQLPRYLKTRDGVC